MDFNKIAELITSVSFRYENYENIVREINCNSELICRPENLEIQELNFESFDEKYLNDLEVYWQEKKQALERKYWKIIHEVDSDDYK